MFGFDIRRGPYPGQLIKQDVMTLHPEDLFGADLIVASPPCDEFSRWGMPWTRAKNPPEPDLRLVMHCFHLARESGIPIILENVRTAQRWLGKADTHWGPFYLWGNGLPPALPPVDYRPKENYSSRRRAERAMIPEPLAAAIAAYWM